MVKLGKYSEKEMHICTGIWAGYDLFGRKATLVLCVLILCCLCLSHWLCGSFPWPHWQIWLKHLYRGVRGRPNNTLAKPNSNLTKPKATMGTKGKTSKVYFSTPIRGHSQLCIIVKQWLLWSIGITHSLLCLSWVMSQYTAHRKALMNHYINQFVSWIFTTFRNIW